MFATENCFLKFGYGNWRGNFYNVEHMGYIVAAFVFLSSINGLINSDLNLLNFKWIGWVSVAPSRHGVYCDYLFRYDCLLSVNFALVCASILFFCFFFLDQKLNKMQIFFLRIDFPHFFCFFSLSWSDEQAFYTEWKEQYSTYLCVHIVSGVCVWCIYVPIECMSMS